MTRISLPITVLRCAIPLLCAALAVGPAFGADEAKPPEKAPPPKAQEQKPAEPKKEKDEKKEEKKEDKKEEKEKPSAPTPPQKSQDTKPPETPAGASDTKKEDAKTPPPSPSQKAQEKPTESKPPENGAPKPTVPPILAVKLALMADPRLFPYEINVEVSGETAELSGKVGDDAEKAAATDIVKGLEGIKSVTNNLEVVKDLNRAMNKKRDDIITQYVKDRFGKSKTLETAHFDVKSDDGIVSLSGKTKFFVIVLEAAEAARQVPGVKAVKTEGIRLEGAD